jgi:hypothetical protein
MRGPSAGELSGMLAQRAPDLVRELLPAGRRQGTEWVVGNLAGEAGRSCSICIYGAKAGTWADFATGQRGDALDLAAACLFLGDRKQAYRWALRWLGIAEGGPATPARPLPAPGSPSKPGDGRARDRAASIFFREAQERIQASPAGLYLDARTGGGFSRLGRHPRALRYHDALHCVEAGRSLPALVAAVVDEHGAFRGIHRIWVAPDSDGIWRKAPLEHPKKAMGRIVGAHIPLWRGASSLPLSKVPHGEVVAISEGIETGLSVAVACPELRIIAAVSLVNLGAVRLPATVTRVILLADEDQNEPAQLALQRAAAAHIVAGRDVRIARPPVGRDFNDVLLHEDEAA